MSAVVLPAGSVLLTGGTLVAVRTAVRLAQEKRERNGYPPSAEYARLLDLLTPPGQPDTPDEPGEEADLMTTNSAAALIGCSPRTVRRLADRLGGRLIGGRWLVDSQAVREHVEGMQCEQ